MSTKKPIVFHAIGWAEARLYETRGLRQDYILRAWYSYPCRGTPTLTASVTEGGTVEITKTVEGWTATTGAVAALFLELGKVLGERMVREAVLDRLDNLED